MASVVAGVSALVRHGAVELDAITGGEERDLLDRQRVDESAGGEVEVQLLRLTHGVRQPLAHRERCGLVIHSYAEDNHRASPPWRHPAAQRGGFTVRLPSGCILEVGDLTVKR